MPTTIEKLKLLLDQLVGANPQDPERFELFDEGVLERMTRSFPFPPTGKPLIGHPSADINNGFSADVDFTKKNWETDQDYYYVGFVFMGLLVAEPFKTYDQGIGIFVFNAEDLTVFDYIELRQYHKIAGVYHTNGRSSISVPGRISKDKTMRFRIFNASGVTIPKASYIYAYGFTEA